MKVLSKKTLQAVKESQQTRNRLAYDLKKSWISINRYLMENNPILTTETAQIAIREELNIPETEEILSEQP